MQDQKKRDASKVSSRFSGYLAGHFLIAMPHLQDSFYKSIIFLCAHDENGAMGLVVNRLLERLKLSDLLKQMGMPDTSVVEDRAIYGGGPLEGHRGFVLHTLEYQQPETLKVTETIGLTATLGVLSDVAQGRGPQKALLLLGYAGWEAGQLEKEIQDNLWLHTPIAPHILFDLSPPLKWQAAIEQLGIREEMLTADSGQA